MICSAFLLLVSNAFIMLRLGSGQTGSFPKPLSQQEERKYVDAWVNHGDLASRNMLIEHNLRLVAHIIKNG